MFFWRRKKMAIREVEQTTDLAAVVGAEEEPFRVEEVLQELEESRDIAQILQVLDAHLEDIQQEDYGEYARQLVSWIDEQLRKEKYPAKYRALLGSVYQRLEQVDRFKSLLRAVELYREALEEYQVAGEEEGIAVILNNMGNALVELGAFDHQYFRQAIPLLEEALEFYREIEAPSCRAFIWMALGEAYSGLQEEGPDHFELAFENYERAWALFERSEAWLEVAEAQGRLGDVQFELGAFYGDGALEKAVRHYRNALAVFVEQNQLGLCGLYQSRLAEAYIGLSNMESEHLHKGMRAYERALDIFEQIDDKGARADTCMELGRLHQVLKDEDENAHLEKAVDRYVHALQLYRDLGRETERGGALQALARVYLEAGSTSDPEDIAQAILLLEEASQIYQLESCAAEFQAIEDELRQARQLLGPLPAG